MTDTATTITGIDLARPKRARRTRRPRATPVADREISTRHVTATGSASRISGDHQALFVIQIIGLAIVAAVGFTISASALIPVGAWMRLPIALQPFTVVMVDAPLLVANAAGVTFKWLEQTSWLVRARIFAITMTAFSSVANFLYTISVAQSEDHTSGLSTYEEVIGAVFHAAAPWIVYVCFEFLGQIITRRKRSAAVMRKKSVKELRKVEREIKARLKKFDAEEKKAALG